jgi:hypothetical protein
MTGLFGLSAREGCRAPSVTRRAVGSYSTGSPLLFCSKSGMFSVVLSVSRPSPVDCLPVRKHDALRCPDFPLPAEAESDETAYPRAKGNEAIGKRKEKTINKKMSKKEFFAG